MLSNSNAVVAEDEDPMQRFGRVSVSGPLLWDSPGHVSRVFGALRVTVLGVASRFNATVYDDRKNPTSRPVPYHFEYDICSPFLPVQDAGPVLFYTIEMSQENIVYDDDQKATYDLYAQFQGIDESRVLVPKWSEE